MKKYLVTLVHPESSAVWTATVDAESEDAAATAAMEQEGTDGLVEVEKVTELTGGSK